MIEEMMPNRAPAAPGAMATPDALAVATSTAFAALLAVGGTADDEAASVAEPKDHKAGDDALAPETTPPIVPDFQPILTAVPPVDQPQPQPLPVAPAHLPGGAKLRPADRDPGAHVAPASTDGAPPPESMPAATPAPRRTITPPDTAPHLRSDTPTEAVPAPIARPRPSAMPGIAPLAGDRAQDWIDQVARQIAMTAHADPARPVAVRVEDNVAGPVTIAAHSHDRATDLRITVANAAARDLAEAARPVAAVAAESMGSTLGDASVDLARRDPRPLGQPRRATIIAAPTDQPARRLPASRHRYA